MGGLRLDGISDCLIPSLRDRPPHPLRPQLSVCVQMEGLKVGHLFPVHFSQPLTEKWTPKGVAGSCNIQQMGFFQGFLSESVLNTPDLFLFFSLYNYLGTAGWAG
jgi:hypothetical protein